jgi:hypothetical protein
MSSNTRREPQGNVLVTAVLIGSLAMLLAGGLNLLGLIARVDGLLTAGLRHGLQTGGFAKALPEWGLWSATAVVAYGLTLAMLSVPGTWRRLVLWVSLLVLLAGWAPVLALASHAPTITAPLVACVWSGGCALIYARAPHPSGDRPPASRPPAAA